MNDEIDLLIRQIRGSETEPFAELIRWYERMTWSNDFSIDATFTAEVTNAYAKVEFHVGDKIVVAATQPPWQINGINLDRGLHALFAVGGPTEGTRRASRPAFAIVV